MQRNQEHVAKGRKDEPIEGDIINAWSVVNRQQDQWRWLDKKTHDGHGAMILGNVSGNGGDQRIGHEYHYYKLLLLRVITQTESLSLFAR